MVNFSLKITKQTKNETNATAVDTAKEMNASFIALEVRNTSTTQMIHGKATLQTKLSE